MQVERLTADVHLSHKPRNGKDAYDMLIKSLEEEIAEKQDILSELKSDSVKKSFIDGWNPDTRSVDIYEM